MVTSWSESSSGSESSASEGESMGCSQAPRHEYRGLFCGYKMVEDYNSDCYGRSLAPNITDLSFHFLLSYLISCLD